MVSRLSREPVSVDKKAFKKQLWKFLESNPLADFDPLITLLIIITTPHHHQFSSASELEEALSVEMIIPT